MFCLICMTFNVLFWWLLEHKLKWLTCPSLCRVERFCLTLTPALKAPTALRGARESTACIFFVALVAFSSGSPGRYGPVWPARGLRWAEGFYPPGRCSIREAEGTSMCAWECVRLWDKKGFFQTCLSICTPTTCLTQLIGEKTMERPAAGSRDQFVWDSPLLETLGWDRLWWTAGGVQLASSAHAPLGWQLWRRPAGIGWVGPSNIEQTDLQVGPNSGQTSILLIILSGFDDFWPI